MKDCKVGSKLAWFLPVISNAVPCAGVVTGTVKPPETVTPLSNPKAFLFLGAFIPQFLNFNQSTGIQIILLGLLFMLIGSIFDSAYAVVFGKFRNLVSSKYLSLLNRIGGILLVVLALWLVLN